MPADLARTRSCRPSSTYNKLRLAKEIQLNMWTHFCIRAAALAGGRPEGGITICTRWVPWDSKLAA